MKQINILIITTLLLFLVFTNYTYAEAKNSDIENIISNTSFGEISIPEESILPGYLKNTVSSFVHVTTPASISSPSAITLISFVETNRVYGAAFPTGTTQEEITNYITSFVDDFVCYDVDGMDYWLPADNWSFADVDTNNPGLYYALAVPDLGDEYVLMEGVALPKMKFAISIQTLGKPELNNCFAAFSSLWFPWVLDEEQAVQPDRFTVWLKQENEAWMLLTADNEYWIQPHCLMVSQYVFEEGSNYILKVVFPDGETIMATFLYKGDLTIVDNSGGDRDGGDVSGGGSGVGNQPSPIFPQTPNNSNKDDYQKNDNNSSYMYNFYEKLLSVLNESLNEQNFSLISVPAYSDTSNFCETENSSYELGSHNASQQEENTKTVLNPMPENKDTQLKVVYEHQLPSIVSESYSPTHTVISGLRLKDLCADEERIVFGSGNLTVSIPSNLLLSMNLSNLDTLTVQLTQPKDNQILLSVEASGKIVKELPGAVLRVKYIAKSENAEIIVHNVTGDYKTNTNFDGELLTFNADTTGTYTILEMVSNQKIQSYSALLIFMLGGLIVIGGGITYFWRRHNG